MPCPKPDFTVFDVAAPSQASNKESVVISWKGRNNGAAFNNYLVDEVLLNDAPNLTTPLASMGSLGEYRNLPNGNVVYNAQKSASIPDIPPGNYFIVVRTNTGGVQEDNLADNFAAVPIEIKTPNLTVTTVNNPATVQAGQTINLQWTIQNTGAGSLPNCPVSDRIRLYYDAAGVNPVPSFNSSFSGSLTLLPGNSAVRQQNITLPNGLANTVWVEIVTNYNNNAYEAGLTADNRRIGLQPIIVSLPDYPNLTPVEISPSAVIATAGNSLSVTYSVQNQGDGPILGNWSDALYLSSSPVLGQGQTWLWPLHPNRK
ncbi:MAG: hypothetical protein IPN33_05625 [Saprospiraceae bacterium]|nr:hypothetical protein [Saprospiraceae bacterium]